MRKKLLTLLAGFMALTASAETLDCTPNTANTGNSSGAYVANETQYEVGAYSFKVNNWNPTSGQIRGNQSSETKNFYWFNATAIPNISKIEITLTSGTLDTTKISFVTGSSADNLSNTGVASFADNVLTLTPSSSSDSFFKLAFSNKATSGTVTASMEDSGFVITYTSGAVEPDTRNEVTLSWPEKQYDAVLENGFTAPTLSVDPEAAKGEVVYSSSDESVATVDANGAVTLVGTGLTTIKAAISDSETYKNASAEYALTVTSNKRENPFTIAFKKGTNKDGSALSSTTTLSDVVLVGEQYVNEINKEGTGTVAYQSTGGLKLGASKNGATVSVKLDQSYVISKIVLGFAPYNTNDNGTVTVNSVEQNFSSSDMPAELVYEYTDKKSVNEIVITTGGSNKRALISSITVYYEEGNQASAELAFANNEYTAFLGTAFTSPKATTVSNGQITYVSSNTDVATVDEQTGDVTVLAVGTTVITASVAETEEFLYGEAKYTLTVVDPNLLSVTFDFKNYDYGMVRGEYNPDPNAFGSGVVSVVTTGVNGSRLWNEDLRFYKANKSMTVSVPAGYEIKFIDIKFIDADPIFTKDEEKSTANSWYYTSSAAATTKVASMTVGYVATADVALSILIDGRDAHEVTYNEQTLVTLTAPKGATIYYVWVANDPEVQSEDNIDSYDWIEAPTNPYSMEVGSNKGNILKVRSSMTGGEIAQLLFQADGTTRIESVVADGAEAPAEWFDLQGRRVAEPANGLYIRRQGRTATKVLVK